MPSFVTIYLSAPFPATLTYSHILPPRHSLPDLRVSLISAAAGAMRSVRGLVAFVLLVVCQSGEAALEMKKRQLNNSGPSCATRWREKFQA